MEEQAFLSIFQGIDKIAFLTQNGTICTAIDLLIEDSDLCKTVTFLFKDSSSSAQMIGCFSPRVVAFIAELKKQSPSQDDE